MRQAAFHRGYIWVALAMAIGGGFAIGSHLTFILGFGFLPGRSFVSFVQLHGHVQLVGWSGLFVMGVSLHFLPRLAAVPIARPHYVAWVLWLMAWGLGLRTVAQLLLPYLTDSPWFGPLAWIAVVSGGLEGGGMLLYVGLLVSTIRGSGVTSARPALVVLRPFLAAMLFGWVLYAGLNAVLLVDMAQHARFVVHGGWNQFATHSFIGLVLLPVAFALSVRLLPLYLRLAVPTWSVARMAYIYLAGLGFQLLPSAPPLFQLAPQTASACASVGQLLSGGVVLWFVWRLAPLTHRQAPQSASRREQAGAERRAPPPGVPDKGEFGRFERLVYAAYVWLTLAACGDIINGLGGVAAASPLISKDAIRHMYVFGFITLLIFGMAVRMLPGFFRKRRVAYPGCVEATFWLGNAAVVCRILLLVIPATLLHAIPMGLVMARIAFALSGLLGLAAVLCLTLNLWRTARLGQE